MGKRIDTLVGVLNGAVGDYLARTDNGLATPMQCMARGAPLPMTRRALARAHPNATTRVVVLVPGIMCTEAVWAFPGAPETDYGTLLARDFGFTPLYLRYNTGRAIAENGSELARLLQALVEEYPSPIEEILLLGFSMGGLVARAACHVAHRDALGWLARVRRAIYLGTPHRGAPYERLGRFVSGALHAVDDPVTRLIGDLADLRSDGVKDLGDADLRHEDRAQPKPVLGLRDPRHPVPLLPEIEHCLVAGSVSLGPWAVALFGDALVPVRSATDGSASEQEGPVDRSGLAARKVVVKPGIAHMALAHHPDVYAAIHRWCEEQR